MLQKIHFAAQKLKKYGEGNTLHIPQNQNPVPASACDATWRSYDT